MLNFRFLLSALALGTFAVSQANLVTNGSFENPTIGEVYDEGFGKYWYDIVALPDWGSDANVVIGRNRPGFWVASDQKQYVTIQSNVATTIFQNINTEVGKTYTLSFDIASDEFGDLSDSGVKLSWGGSDAGTFTAAGRAGSIIPWESVSLSLIATTTITELRFTDVAGSTFFAGAYLDNVKVVEAVPEPATLAALALGVGALVRRKRK